MKGDIAKKDIKDKIIAVLGKDYIGEFDKKLYCWANDGGEKVQVSIALTCPKVFKGGDSDGVESTVSSNEISSKEMENLESLMKKFGI